MAISSGQRDARGHDRQQPQHRAAVGQQQEQDDHGQCGGQQRGVDTLEYLPLVGGVGRRVGHVSGEAWALSWVLLWVLSWVFSWVLLRGGLDTVDEAAQVGVVAEVRADDGLDRLVVPGHRGVLTRPFTCGSAANLRASALALVRSAVVIPLDRTYTTTAGFKFLA